MNSSSHIYINLYVVNVFSLWNIAPLARELLGRSAAPAPVGAPAAYGGVADFTAPGGDRPLLQPVQCFTTSRLNTIAFHPTEPLFVTAADDRDVRVWQFTGDHVRPVETLIGHGKHATAAIFHPRRHLVLSCAEDKTLRVWDLKHEAQPVVVDREQAEYWVLDAHPTQELFAAGHETGFYIFKLNRERPAFCSDATYTPATATIPASSEVTTHFYRDGTVFSLSSKPGAEPRLAMPLHPPRKVTPANAPRALLYNSWNRNLQCFLTVSPDNSYELFTRDRAAGAGDAPSSILKGYAKSAAFVSSTRFVTLEKNRTVLLKSLKNEVKRRIVVPGAQQIFPAGVGRVLVRCSESILLLAVHALRPIAELPLASRHPVEHAVWSPDMRHVALWSRTHVYIATSKLELVATASEGMPVKSAAWDPAGVLVYATESQLKYLLPSGDCGVLRALEQPVYLTHANNAEAGFLDRLHCPGRLRVNSIEYQFKLALLRHRSRDVARIMQSKQLIGQSIVAYVQRKGYPEIAMHFVHDVRLRFALALECGNIEVAKDAAGEINETPCWQQLGAEALRHGAYDVAEGAFFRARDFQRLTFLYLILGDSSKLQQLRGIAMSRGNVMGAFHASLLLGDVPARVAILRAADQHALAYAAAVAHGLSREAEDIAVHLQQEITRHHAEAQQAAEEGVRFSALAPAPAPDLSLPTSRLLSMAELAAAVHADDAYAAALAPAAAKTAAERGVFFAANDAAAAAAAASVSSENSETLVVQPALPPVAPSAAAAAGLNGYLLLPPPPAWPLAGPWPKLAVRRGFDFSREGTEADAAEAAALEAEEQERLAAEQAARADEENDMGWDSSSSSGSSSAAAGATGGRAGAAGGAASAASPAAAAGGGDWDLGIDLGDELEGVDAEPAGAVTAVASAGASGYGFVMPEAGRSPIANWASLPLAGALVSAGAFDQAMHVLNQQYGITHFAPFKKIFVQNSLLASAQTTLLPWLPAQPAPLTSKFELTASAHGHPPTVASVPVARYTLAAAQELRREIIAAMTAGNFPAALQLVQLVALNTPLMVLNSEEEQTAALAVLASAREYGLALKLDAARNAAAEAPRKAELAAYSTHCAVEPMLMVLLLWIACKFMFQIKNYRCVGVFCRRILDIAGTTDVSSLQGKVDFEMVRKMLKKCEQEGVDHTPIRYDPTVLFAVCATGFVPLPGTKAAEGREVVVCGLCGAKHAMEHQGKICTVCNVAKLGAPASGPRLFVASK